MKLKAAIEFATERQADWQKWRIQSINMLEARINNGLTCLYLKEPLRDGMVVSQHIAEITLKKAMSLLLFLRLMHNRDDINNTEVNGEMMASTLAERAGSLLSVSRSFVYRTYKEWRDG